MTFYIYILAAIVSGFLNEPIFGACFTGAALGYLFGRFQGQQDYGGYSGLRGLGDAVLDCLRGR